jgi:hypothetical protein
VKEEISQEKDEDDEDEMFYEPDFEKSSKGPTSKSDLQRKRTIKWSDEAEEELDIY